MSRDIFPARDPWRTRRSTDQITSKLTKLHRHDHKGLVNMSTEGIDELLHGLGEVGEIRSKIGFFSRTQKLWFVVTRDFGGFSTMLDDFESLQRVTKTSRNNSSSRAQESTKENWNSFKQSTRWMNSNRKQTPGGHKEDWASFPTQFQYKSSKIRTSNP